MRQLCVIHLKNVKIASLSSLLKIKHDSKRLP
nr:MAG TPA: hypothetical protein [Caudoviricetes sp.]